MYSQFSTMHLTIGTYSEAQNPKREGPNKLANKTNEISTSYYHYHEHPCAESWDFPSALLRSVWHLSGALAESLLGLNLSGFLNQCLITKSKKMGTNREPNTKIPSLVVLTYCTQSLWEKIFTKITRTRHTSSLPSPLFSASCCASCFSWSTKKTGRW